MNRDYEIITSRAVSEINHYDGTGTAMSIAANRVSFTFNLTGPSLTVDTACSSFLFALHYALRAIKSGNGTKEMLDNDIGIFTVSVYHLGHPNMSMFLFDCRRLWGSNLWWGELHHGSPHLCMSQQSQNDLSRGHKQTLLKKSRRLWKGRRLRCCFPQTTEKGNIACEAAWSKTGCLPAFFYLQL